MNMLNLTLYKISQNIYKFVALNLMIKKLRNLVVLYLLDFSFLKSKSLTIEIKLHIFNTNKNKYFLYKVS